jgi:hypothetical protein
MTNAPYSLTPMLGTFDFQEVAERHVHGHRLRRSKSVRWWVKWQFVVEDADWQRI